VPNVDADTETAITNMKILNLLVDLRAEAKQLILSGVVKSLPDGDEIWCKASEMSRDNFADWYDNL